MGGGGGEKGREIEEDMVQKGKRGCNLETNRRRGWCQESSEKKHTNLRSYIFWLDKNSH